MKKTLTWWDLLWFGLGVVMGARIFILTGLISREQAGPAVFLSFLAFGVSVLLSVLCYTEFVVEVPIAGGSFAYLRVKFGGFVAFIVVSNILFEYIVASTSVASKWAFKEFQSHPQNPHHLHHISERLEELESAFKDKKTFGTSSVDHIDTASSCSCTDSCFNDDEIQDQLQDGGGGDCFRRCHPRTRLSLLRLDS
ncbi:hypothetical protein NE237_028077 [Protea cynaroides]|uniref:DUF7610 domain-containing protein n=1 Tax=Protea cynaroides TaxID=273540 RepID=A0A9Q0JUT4_9MAGN|nr:hypothetical protein NE237_028077 [Protea cynaroides]